MALDMISSIKRAEAEAEKIIKDAQAEAKQILKAATDRSYKIAARCEEDTAREAKEVIKKGAEGAETQCAELLNNAEREISAMRELCLPKKQKAIQLIMSRISR